MHVFFVGGGGGAANKFMHLLKLRNRLKLHAQRLVYFFGVCLI
jgi:hypothetical protein